MNKGIGYHVSAKIMIVLAAYVLHFALGKILSVEEYGIIGTIVTFCNFYYMFSSNGVKQEISQEIAEGRYGKRDIFRKGMIVQSVLAVFLAIGNYLIAPIMAGAFGDENFIVYIRELSWLIIFTAIYFALTGTLNGIKIFWAEAFVLVLYQILRLLSIPLAYFGENKPFGVILGFILSAVISTIVSVWLIFRQKEFKEKTLQSEKIGYKETILTSCKFVVSSAAITLVLNVDTFFLQYVEKDKELTGYYTGVHTFSLVPYYLISAFYTVILPYVSENFAKKDFKKIGEILRKNMEIITVLILPVTLVLAISSGDLLHYFYNRKYMVAASSLTILAIGIYILSVYSILNVVMNAMEMKKLSLLLSVLIVVLDVVLQLLLIPRRQLIGSSLATTIAALMGYVISYVVLYRKLGAFEDLKFLGKAYGLILGFVAVCVLIFNIIGVNHFLVFAGIYLLLAVLYLWLCIKLGFLNIKEIVKKKA